MNSTMKTSIAQKCIALATLAAALTFASCATPPEAKFDPNGTDAQRAFARLKLLAGHWNAQVDVAGATPADGTAAKVTVTVPIEYSVTSGGHVLQEKLHAGEPDEMITMYYLDGEGLAAIHYCSMGNRPHMRFDVVHSTRDDLHFEWDGTATDINPKIDAHIHEGRIHFVDADTIECEWAFWVDGKESHRAQFKLSRASGGFTPLAK